MALRKEWFAELLDACQKYAVNQINYPLKPLDKNAITKILCALVEDNELQQTYRLRIEPSCTELGNQIADDLLTDSQSGIAPTLQIILYQLWEKTKDESDRVWTKELYVAEIHRGLLLENYVDHQLNEIAKQKTWGKEAKESGLLLDVLFAHATQQGTSQNLDATDYEERYSHIHYRRDLLDTLKKHYLLVDTYTNKATAPSTQTRLVHDTLAQVIENKYDSSMYPGQKARRILEGRKAEWKSEGHRYVGLALSRHDLQQIEKGQNGTSNWRKNPCESAIMRKSIRRRKFKNALNAAVIFMLIGTFASSIWFGFQAREQTRAAIINSLLTHAHALSREDYQSSLSNNTDLALLLALYAEKLETDEDKRSETYKTISQILYSSGAYRTPSQKGTYGVDAGDELWTFYKDGRITIKNKKSRRSFVLQSPTLPTSYFPDNSHFDAKTGRLVTIDNSKRNFQIWDTETRKRHIITLDDNALPIDNFEIDKSGIIITWNDREKILWNDFGGRIKTINLYKKPTKKTSNFTPIDYEENIDSNMQDTNEKKQINDNMEKIILDRDSQKIVISSMRTFIILDEVKNTIRYFDLLGHALSEAFPISNSRST